MVERRRRLRLQQPAAARPARPGGVASSPPTSALRPGRRARQLGPAGSIGQNDVQATPLQMALVAAGVANDGVVMTPHVMAEIRDRDGRGARDAYAAEAVAHARSAPATAATMRAAMVGVVQQRHGHAAWRHPGGVRSAPRRHRRDAADGRQLQRLGGRLRRPDGKPPGVAFAVMVEAAPERRRADRGPGRRARSPAPSSKRSLGRIRPARRDPAAADAVPEPRDPVSSLAAAE